MKDAKFKKPKKSLIFSSYFSLVAVLFIVVGLLFYIVRYDMDEDYRNRIAKINQSGFATDKDKFVTDEGDKIGTKKVISLQQKEQERQDDVEDADEEDLDLNAKYFISCVTDESGI